MNHCRVHNSKREDKDEALVLRGALREMDLIIVAVEG